MPTADENLATVREWTGSQPDDVTILTALATAEALPVALHILRVRYADMVANPAKWAVVDDYSQDASENLKLLAAQIRRLEGTIDETGVTAEYGWQTVYIEGPSLAR